jgi:Histidine phosphatase superfamily (branch 1)
LRRHAHPWWIDRTEAAAISLHRRPFLAPIWFTVLLVVIAAVVAFELYRSATTTTFIVVPAAESTLGSIRDAPLSPEGEQRADQLAQLFGSAVAQGRIAAIYVSSMRRTQQTAAPLAARLGVEPVVAGGSADASIAKALGAHRGDTVMIVSSVPSEVVEALTGIAPPAPSGDGYGRIYIVSDPLLGSPGLVELHY